MVEDKKDCEPAASADKESFCDIYDISYNMDDDNRITVIFSSTSRA